MYLKQHFDEMAEAGKYKTFPTHTNSYTGEEIVRKIDNGSIIHESLSLNLGVLSMILFGIELPKCYFTEDMNGKRTCVYGHQILSSIAYVARNQHKDEMPLYLNRVLDVNVPCVTFGPDVSESQVKSFIYHLKGMR